MSKVILNIGKSMNGQAVLPRQGKVVKVGAIQHRFASAPGNQKPATLDESKHEHVNLKTYTNEVVNSCVFPHISKHPQEAGTM